VHLDARAQGGSGLIMTESAAVAPGYQVPFARSVRVGAVKTAAVGMLVGRVRLRRSCAAATRRGLRRPGGAAGAVLAAASRAQVGHEMARSGLPADIHTRGAHGTRARTGLTHPRFIRVTGDAIDPTFSGSR
jgi:hypothetical protein